MNGLAYLVTVSGAGNNAVPDRQCLTPAAVPCSDDGGSGWVEGAKAWPPRVVGVRRLEQEAPGRTSGDEVASTVDPDQAVATAWLALP